MRLDYLNVSIPDKFVNLIVVPHTIWLVPTVNVFRRPKRVADQAADIAEDVIYMCEGRNIGRQDHNSANKNIS